MYSYTATTEEIRVTVRPVYLDGQSDALSRKFVFAYYITIENQGDEEVQLLRRHWFIQDGMSDVKEVEGEGVVGQKPVIKPGDAHQYSSFCVVETFEGTMEGTYLMQRPNGELFYVMIPRFPMRAMAN